MWLKVARRHQYAQNKVLCQIYQLHLETGRTAIWPLLLLYETDNLTSTATSHCNWLGVGGGGGGVRRHEGFQVSFILCTAIHFCVQRSAAAWKPWRRTACLKVWTVILYIQFIAYIPDLMISLWLLDCSKHNLILIQTGLGDSFSTERFPWFQVWNICKITAFEALKHLWILKIR